MVHFFEHPQNRLLAALPASEYQQLLPHIENVSLVSRQILQNPREAIEYVYFPYEALISLVQVLEDGSTIEVNLVGNEGMVGIQAFLGNTTMPYQAVTQLAGKSGRISVTAFQAECNYDSALFKLLLKYLRFLLLETAQGLACNSAHIVEERLARWLLTASDRLDSHYLPFTQDAIAQMLGIRRASVTVAAGVFQQAGMIYYQRGEITILDRENLEATACECYKVIKTELEQLLSSDYQQPRNGN